MKNVVHDRIRRFLTRRIRGYRAALLLSALVFSGLSAQASGQTITEFPLSPGELGSGPLYITAGPDGNLWFTEYNVSKVGRMTPAGAVTEFPTLTSPTGITVGPDGNVWHTEQAYDLGREYITRITPAGAVTRFLAPCCENFPNDITAGPDGNLWFTETGFLSNKVGRITTSGVIAEFPIPTPPGLSITAGPDGSLWFTAPNRIGRITTSGTVTEFSIPTSGSGGGHIAAGPDGNLWFTESGANKIGRITTAGVITEFPIPTPSSAPADITVGTDGNLWFTESAANKIGRITTAGVITEFTLPTPGSRPFGITTGPDGNIWFTELDGNKIGRLAIPAAPEVDRRILPVVGSTPGANGTFFRTSVQLNNPGSAPTTGRIVFHPSGAAGSDTDLALSYSLAPGQTQSIADLLPAMGRSGLGSADIEITSGAAPVATARVFNDAGAAGTMGFTEEPMRSEDALRPGVSGTLLLPADLTRFRFNLGVRTLEAGATVALTLRDASGAVVETLSRDYSATYHEQQSASAFLDVSTLPAGGSIGISVTSGAAIFYGATVDNSTGDPSLQIGRPAP